MHTYIHITIHLHIHIYIIIHLYTGNVPSLKSGKGERIRAGQDQIRTIEGALKKVKIRTDARKEGILLDVFRRGDTSHKAQEIEMDSQFALEREAVAKEARDRDHLLNETETTLRFGVFMMTLMYFRVMTLLKREKRSWGGEDDDALLKRFKRFGKKEKRGAQTGMTKERMRIVNEAHNTAARNKRLEVVMVRCRIGDQKRLERSQLERKEEINRMLASSKRQRLEALCTGRLQRAVRGHLGRLNVRKWALKRAELDAMTMVLNRAATDMQRFYRGYLGRLVYSGMRMQLAQV